jgi:predicted kinase
VWGAFLTSAAQALYLVFMTKLIAMTGLPGVGKTTLARALARQMRAVFLRVDTAEAALKNSILKIHSAEDAGYLILAGLAEDNLLLGVDVIVDTVNPIEITRKMWGAVSTDANAVLVNVEVVCNDVGIHRERVESRSSDIDGLIVPTWDEVLAREYTPWTDGRIIVDTSKHSASECVAKIAEAIRSMD